MSDDRILPMTALETRLKEAFLQHRIGNGKILSNVELASYITTLMRENADRPGPAQETNEAGRSDGAFLP